MFPSIYYKQKLVTVTRTSETFQFVVKPDLYRMPRVKKKKKVLGDDEREVHTKT